MKTKFKIFIVIFLSLIVFSGIFGVSAKASAATYYVKNGGNDSLSGLDDANAWETITKVEATVTSGDTVYFRSQDTWTGPNPLIIAKAGVAYDGATYGSGTRATLQASSLGSYYGIVHICDDNITFSGFKVDSNSLSIGGVYVGYVPTGTKNFSNVVVDNCEVINGATAIENPERFYYGIIVGAQGLHETSDIQIINNIVHDVGHEGITIYPSWETVPGNNSVDTVLVRNNLVYNTGQVPFINTELPPSNRGNAIEVANDSDNVTVEFNTTHDSGVNGCSVHTYNYAQGGDGSPDNVHVRYNLFYNNHNGLNLGPSVGDGDGFGSVYVYSNIIINNSLHLGGNFKSSTTKVYNNIVYRNDNLGEAFNLNSVTAVVKPEVKNNVFVIDNYNYIVHDLYADSFANIIHENNLYYRTSGASGRYVQDGDLIYYTGTEVKSTWESSAQITSPNFMGGTLPTGFSGTYGTNLIPNTDYFKITSGDAINNGATLGSPYDGNINTAGTSNPIARLAGVNDIGAYEYFGTDTTSPGAPSGLAVD